MLCFLPYLPIYPKKKKQSARVKKRQPKHTVIKDMTHVQTFRGEDGKCALQNVQIDTQAMDYRNTELTKTQRMNIPANKQ